MSDLQQSPLEPEDSFTDGAVRSAADHATQPVSLAALQAAALERQLTLPPHWTCTDDLRLLDTSTDTYYSSVSLALESIANALPSREQLFHLAQFHHLVHGTSNLPFKDGPILVLNFGSQLVAQPEFFSNKKLYPIGYRSIAFYQPESNIKMVYQLNCQIHPADLTKKKKGPIFVVQLQAKPLAMFRSFSATKAWKKACLYIDAHLDAVPAAESLCPTLTLTQPSDLIGLRIVLPDDSTGHVSKIDTGADEASFTTSVKLPDVDVLVTLSDCSLEKMAQMVASEPRCVLTETLSQEEDGFGLLRHNIVRVMEGLDRNVLNCTGYRFYGERHVFDLKSHETDLFRTLGELVGQKDALLAKTTWKLQHKQAKQSRKRQASLEKQRESKRAKVESHLKKEERRKRKEEEKLMKDEEKETRRHMRELEKVKKTAERKETLRLRELAKQEQIQAKLVAVHERKRLRKGSPRGCKSSSATSHASILVYLQKLQHSRQEATADAMREYAISQRVKGLIEADAVDPPVIVTNQPTPFPTLPKALPPDLLIGLEQDSNCAADDLFFVWDFLSTFAHVLELTSVPPLGVFLDILALSDRSSADGNGRVPEFSNGRWLATLHITLLSILLKDTVPLLDMGTVGLSVEDFLKTRPMNIFSWPETARLCCQLAHHHTIEANDVMLRSIKGNKTSSRYDSIAIPLRETLLARGNAILQHQPSSVEAPKSDTPSSSVVPCTPVVAKDRQIVGLVLAQKPVGLTFTLQKDMILLESIGNTTTSPGMEKLKVGMQVVSVNGELLQEDASVEDLEEILDSAELPLGLVCCVPGVVQAIQEKSVVSPVVLEEGDSKEGPTVPVGTPLTKAQQFKRCLLVIDTLRQKETASPFNQPVDGELYPDYYDSRLIAVPMDLGSIQEKVEDDEYETVKAFQDDVALVWANCYTFNSESAAISHMAKRLNDIFNRLMQEWVLGSPVRALQAPIETYCRQCSTSVDMSQLLFCSRCDAAYHRYCLNPSLLAVPKGSWYCVQCAEFEQDDTTDPDDMDDELPHWVFHANANRLKQSIELLSLESYGNDTTVVDRIVILRTLCELVVTSSTVIQDIESSTELANQVRKEQSSDMDSVEHEWRTFGLSNATSQNVSSKQLETLTIDSVKYELTDDVIEQLIVRLSKDKEDKEKEDDMEDDAMSVESVDDDSIESASVVSEEDDVEAVITPLVDEMVTFIADCLESDTESDDYAEELTEEDEIMELYTNVFTPPDVCFSCGFSNHSLEKAIYSPLDKKLRVASEYITPKVLYANTQELCPFSAILVDSTNLIKFSRSTTNSDLLYDNSSVVLRIQNQVPIDSSVPSISDIVYSFNPSKRICYTNVDATSTTTIHLTPPRVETFRDDLQILPCADLLQADFRLESHGVVYIASLDDSTSTRKGLALLYIHNVWCKGASIDTIQHLLTTHAASYCAVYRETQELSIAAEIKSLTDSTLAQKEQQLKMKARHYSVQFQAGPLGMGLAMTPDSKTVVVRSLNNPNGRLGQAAISRRIHAGDHITGINGEVYNATELAQFTTLLLAEPRPVLLNFYRPMHVTAEVPLSPPQKAAEAERYVWVHAECLPLYAKVRRQGLKLYKSLSQVRAMEEAIERVISRSSELGRCPTFGHAYFQFNSDKSVLFIRQTSTVDPEQDSTGGGLPEWFCAQTARAISSVITALMNDTANQSLVKTLKKAFHVVLHQRALTSVRVQVPMPRLGLTLQRPLSVLTMPECCPHAQVQFWNETSLSLRKCVYYDKEQHRLVCYIVYFGHRYFLGHFLTQAEAEAAYEQAVDTLVKTGSHLSDFKLRTARMMEPLKFRATKVWKRLAVKNNKTTPVISAAVLKVLELGIRYFQPQMAVTGLKKKSPVVAGMTAAAAGPIHSSLQTLVEAGQQLMKAWPLFCENPTALHIRILSQSCSHGYHSVKQVLALLTRAPASAPHAMTFAAVYHTYLVALLAEYVSKAMMMSVHNVNKASATLMKAVVDAFGSALMATIDPTDETLNQSYTVFQTISAACILHQTAWTTAPVLSNNNVTSSAMTMQVLTNDIVSFSNRYLSQAGHCKNITCPANMLSAPFQKDLIALHAAKDAHTTRLKHVTSRGGGGSVTSTNVTTVDFYYGPLGIVINQEGDNGKIIVSRFTLDTSGTPGQAQKSGRVRVGDEVMAVNGQPISAVGMDGFRTAVQSLARPLRVTFRSSNNHNPMLLQPSPPPRPVLLQPSVPVQSLPILKPSTPVVVKPPTPVAASPLPIVNPSEMDFATSRRSNRKTRPVAHHNVTEDDSAVSSDLHPTIDVKTPVAGKQGYFATDALDPYIKTIRHPTSDNAPAIVFLRAHLIRVESCIPRDAFKAGYWCNVIRLAWAEHAYRADSSAALMEVTLFLESVLDNEWMESIWKGSPIPSAKAAMANVTIASAAMRLFALDKCVTYSKKYKRKPKKSMTLASADDATQANDSHLDIPSLSFLTRLPPGILEQANRLMSELVLRAAKRDSPASTCEKWTVAFHCGLNMAEIELWYGTVTGDVAVETGPSALRIQTGVSESDEEKDNATLSSSRKRRSVTPVAQQPPPPQTVKKTRRSVKVVKPQLVRYRFMPRCPGYPTPGSPDPTLMPRVMHVVEYVQKNSLAWPFNHPVDASQVAGYAQLIKQPMDLGTIHTKLKLARYTNVTQVVEDVNLVWHNCRLFNTEESEIGHSGHRLSSVFDRLFEEWVSRVQVGTCVSDLRGEDQCRECDSNDDSDNMLLCDSCDAAFHMGCLEDPITSIPTSDWFCPRCELVLD